MISIDDVVTECLVALYSNDLFREKIYLKGGQAVRIAEKVDQRFSTDIDFSVENKLENTDEFFNYVRESLYNHFNGLGYYLFDFLTLKKPKVRADNIPDFWSGWQIEFKLILAKFKLESLDVQRRNAFVPKNSNTSKIVLEISEYEYCSSLQKIKIKNQVIMAYSRPLIVLEKLRAICQQHSDYKYASIKQRARDYYDIANLLEKSESDKETDLFLEQCRKHISGVFKAKEVPLEIIDKIFEENFLKIQHDGWKVVEATTPAKNRQDFDYYVAVLKDFSQKLK